MIVQSLIKAVITYDIVDKIAMIETNSPWQRKVDPLDTIKCAALLKALEVGNLSVAAAQLGYTPSGISRMMATLESELGFPLLFRGKSGVAPTPECETMLPSIRQVVHAAEVCRQNANRICGMETGSVRVGCAYPEFYGPLAHIIAAFKGQYPGITIDLSQASSSHLLKMLQNHEVDLCIMSERNGNHKWQPLVEDVIVALLNKSNPRANTSPFPLRCLEEEPYILIFPNEETDNSRVLKHCDIKPNIQFTVHDVSAAFQLVAAGLGVTLMNTIHLASAPSELAALPVDPPSKVDIGLASIAEDEQTPAVESFKEFALPKLLAFSNESKGKRH